jgi:glucosamine-6-phosphate deaminase
MTVTAAQQLPDISSTEKLYHERIPTHIFPDSITASKAVAQEIADAIRDRAKQGKHIVLGLATGSTPTRVYDELVRMHKEEGLSFQNVITFNLDEYYPMAPDSQQSYVRFMHEYLFDHVDIKPENVHIPDGTVKKEGVASYCREYEQAIKSAGGLDIQILGIGRTGHIGFNEPGSRKDSLTRMVTLDRRTRIDAASDFYSEDYVPRNAITMGVGTILTARRIIMMAWGEGKAGIIKKAVEESVTDLIPASFLQEHPNVAVVIDEAAAASLTRTKTPWLVGPCEWTPQLAKTAVLWLSLYLGKPILKLTDADYNEHGMADLLIQYGRAYNLNIDVFNKMQNTITGWPGGKPNADDERRPERAKPFPKRVVIFSPHPDDDVISMGGTFIRLVDQGHDVHVAYQTSGNIAVHDDDAIRFADFLADVAAMTGKLDAKEAQKVLNDVKKAIKNKKPAEVDAPIVQHIKGLIRRGEAKAGCRSAGISDDHAHFLDMPFYETGRVKKKPLSEADIQIIIDLLQQIKPHQIYAAGDLSDPHGTHRVCLDAIFRALAQLKTDPKNRWLKDCYVWLYRGAWQEWEIEKIEMAVPLSPQEVERKKVAIFKHQSQKDKAVFPGSDPREFWQRAQDRNKATAELYDKLGLAEYEAMEAFVRYHFL